MEEFERMDKDYNKVQSMMTEYAYKVLDKMGSFMLKEAVPITVRSERNGYKPLIEYISEVKVLPDYPHYEFVSDVGYEYYPEDIRPEELWELIRAIKEQL